MQYGALRGKHLELTEVLVQKYQLTGEALCGRTLGEARTARPDLESVAARKVRSGEPRNGGCLYEGLGAKAAPHPAILLSIAWRVRFNKEKCI